MYWLPKDLSQYIYYNDIDMDMDMDMDMDVDIDTDGICVAVYAYDLSAHWSLKAWKPSKSLPRSVAVTQSTAMLSHNLGLSRLQQPKSSKE